MFHAVGLPLAVCDSPPGLGARHVLPGTDLRCALDFLL
jgi:hypothetical protein